MMTILMMNFDDDDDDDDDDYDYEGDFSYKMSEEGSPNGDDDDFHDTFWR